MTATAAAATIVRAASTQTPAVLRYLFKPAQGPGVPPTAAKVWVPAAAISFMGFAPAVSAVPAATQIHT
jgi:hypothetical protein